MRAYCFDFVSHDGSIENYDVGVFASDAEAEHEARAEMLASTTAVLVDVWSEGERVTRIRRDGRDPVGPRPASGWINRR